MSLPLRRLALLVGAGSMGAQALLFREHLLAYNGNELGVGGFLAAWLLWIALGALLAAWWLPRSVRGGATAFALVPPALLAQLVLYWHLRPLAGIPVGGTFPLVPLIAWTGATTAPVSLLTGYLFAWLGRQLPPPRSSPPTTVRRGVWSLYASEALGSAIGGAGATVAAIYGQEPGPWLVALCLIWYLGLAAAFLPTRRPLAAGFVGLAMALIAWAAGGGLSWLETGRSSALPVPPGVTVQATADTPFGHTAVARYQDWQVALSNGRPGALFPADDAVVDAALLETHSPDPGPILALGRGALATACELQARRASALTLVDVDGEGLTLLRTQIAEVHECLSRPGVAVVEMDPANYLQALPPTRFGLVIYGMGEPRRADAVLYYTPGFLRTLKAHLAPRGVVALAATATANVLAGPERTYLAQLTRSLEQVFEQVQFTAGERMWFFCARMDGVLPANLAETTARFSRLEARYPELTGDLFYTLYDEARIAARRKALEMEGEGVATWDRPALYISRVQADEPEGSWFRDLSWDARLIWLFPLLVMSALVALTLSSTRGRTRGAGAHLLIFVCGLTGMAGQVMILLAFQWRFGMLYAAFGGLNAAFLVGLAAGSGMSHWPRRLSAIAPALAGFGLLLLLLAVAALPMGLVLLSPLALGLLIGWGLRHGVVLLEEAGRTPLTQAVWLTCLDHAGGLVGAILAALVLVPFVGLVTSALGLLLLGLAPAIVHVGGGLGRVWTDWRRVPFPLLRFLVLWGVVFGLARSLGPGEAPREVIAERASVTAMVQPTATDSSWPRCKQMGWGGPMELRVALDDQGRIDSVRMGRNVETPEYLFGINDWLSSFQGLDATRLTYASGSGPADVDAFSGATVTGKAIVSIVRCVAKGPEDLTQGTHGSNASRGGPRLNWTLIVLLAMVVVGAAVYFSGTWLPRTLWLLVLGLGGGLLANQQFSYDALLRAVLGPRPPWSNIAFWGLAGGAVGLALLVGAVHCGTICPAGAVQGLLGRLGLRWRVAPAVDRPLRQVKYLLAAMLLWAAIVGVDGGSGDLLRFAFSGRYDSLGWGLLSVTVLAALVWHRPWCRYLCPLGAVLSFGEPVAGLGRLGPKRSSAGCHVGVRLLQDSDCIRCNRCVTPVTLKEPRFFRRRMAGPGLVAVVLVLLLLATLRLSPGAPATSAQGSGNPGPPSVVEPAGGGSPDFGAETTGKDRPVVTPEQRLFRRDNDAYPVQRRPGSDRIREWLDGGKLSPSEALFYRAVE